ncbi:hypothetical protein M011DRAFT_527352 [Sporormia fimetaria CBS 119925]|uniref:Uncharacterized protein n=1 Tax=Sporormia fimetaria CBS 119925 TaxID=1340428 RepID=A0A6A6V5H8_9PLEO|nr:hypothetical protein M011DRAFT_527352 [Sporormia fimetaria CBS 119925]
MAQDMGTKQDLVGHAPAPGPCAGAQHEESGWERALGLWWRMLVVEPSAKFWAPIGPNGRQRRCWHSEGSLEAWQPGGAGTIPWTARVIVRQTLSVRLRARLGAAPHHVHHVAGRPDKTAFAEPVMATQAGVGCVSQQLARAWQIPCVAGCPVLGRRLRAGALEPVQTCPAGVSQLARVCPAAKLSSRPAPLTTPHTD